MIALFLGLRCHDVCALMSGCVSTRCPLNEQKRDICLFKGEIYAVLFVLLKAVKLKLFLYVTCLAWPLAATR